MGLVGSGAVGRRKGRLQDSSENTFWTGFDKWHDRIVTKVIGPPHRQAVPQAMQLRLWIDEI
jgi:hypothetical protein